MRRRVSLLEQPAEGLTIVEIFFVALLILRLLDAGERLILARQLCASVRVLRCFH